MSQPRTNRVVTTEDAVRDVGRNIWKIKNDFVDHSKKTETGRSLDSSVNVKLKQKLKHLYCCFVYSTFKEAI